MNRRRRSVDSAQSQNDGASPPSERLRRRLGSVYTFTKQHFELVDELRRLFPDRPRAIDFMGIQPGLESVELVSRKLLAKFQGTLDQGVFLVFCKLNAARVRDYFVDRIEEEAWPLDPDELLAEVYSRLFQYHRRRNGSGWPPELASPFAKPIDESRTLYEMFVEAGEWIMTERVESFRAMVLPLPGLPMVPCSPPPSTVKAAQSVAEEHGWKMPEEELKGWASFAVLRMKREDRRVLHLRDMRGLSLHELADVLGCTAFEAAQHLKISYERLREQILQLVRAFSNGTHQAAGEQAEGDESGEGESDD